MTFSFTTAPRAVVEAAPPGCHGWAPMDPSSSWVGCRLTDQARAAVSTSLDYGRCYKWRDQDPETGYWYSSGMSGAMLVPGEAFPVQLKSFQWTAVNPDPAGGAGLISFYRTRANTDWTKDKAASEGDLLVSNPVWSDTNNDRRPETLDPVAYSGTATAGLYQIALASERQTPFDAIIRVSTNNGALTFPDFAAHFDQGQAAITGPVASQVAFSAGVANIDATLTWSASLDSGVTFTEFAATTHKIFVTLAPPLGFPAFRKVPARPHVTAARLNRATAAANGRTTASGVAVAAKNAVLNDIRFSAASLLDEDAKRINLNPWAVLESPSSYTNGLDCISLAILTVPLIRHAGVNAMPTWAYPTMNGDVSARKKIKIPSGSTWINTYLDFLLGTGWAPQAIEGYLYVQTNGQPSEAHTLAPNAGPLMPQPAGSVPGLDRNPLNPLGFAVLRNTLQLIRLSATDPKGGQQWWVTESPLAPYLGPEAFPTLP